MKSIHHHVYRVSSKGGSQGSPDLGLVLLQDHVTGELGLRGGGELVDDHLHGQQPLAPQLVSDGGGGHEAHPDQLREVQHQEVGLDLVRGRCHANLNKDK